VTFLFSFPQKKKLTETENYTTHLEEKKSS